MPSDQSGQSSSAPRAAESQETISPALRRRLQQCFDHGTKLTSQEKCDYDYANTMFTECVVNDPGNLVYVEAFLDNLQRKYNNNKKGARGLGFGGNRGPLKKAQQRQDWAEVLRIGPPLLKTNPWDVTTLRAMAEACAAHRFNEVELRYLKNALDANPKDAEVNRHCAKSLGRMGQFDQAIVCWQRVGDAKRGDPEVPKMISLLTLEKARGSKGLDLDDSPSPADKSKNAAADKPSQSANSQPADPDDDLLEDAEPAANAEAESAAAGKRREIPLTPRQQLERAIRIDPAILDNYFKLADLLIEEQRFAEAERTMARAQTVSPGDMDIQRRLEEAQVGRARHQLAIAEKQAESEKTDEARELVSQLRSDLNRLELDILQKRSQRQPDDREIKFQLGLRLRRSGNFAEAVKYFQEARHDGPRKAASALEIGTCLQQMRQYERALEFYEKAIRDAGDEMGTKTLALYRAGVLAGGLKRFDAAEQYLGQVLEIDAGYKDAAARLDKFRQIRDKDGSSPG